MFTENLMIFGITGAMPSEAFWSSGQLGAAALTPSFGHTAAESSHPSFNLIRLRTNNLDRIALIDGLTITQV